MKLKNKSLEIGLLYFYIHFVTEVTCFFILNELFKLPISAWIIALTYDALAFVPQSIFGYLRDINKNVNFGLLGLFLLFAAVILNGLISINKFLILIILCLGNVLAHVEGAEATLRSSDGK